MHLKPDDESAFTIRPAISPQDYLAVFLALERVLCGAAGQTTEVTVSARGEMNRHTASLRQSKPTLQL